MPLARGRQAVEELAQRLGSAGGIILLRDNGAVTVGSNVGAAVGRMWVLEASAEINRTAVAVGTPQVPNEEEFSCWESVSEEILERRMENRSPTVRAIEEGNFWASYPTGLCSLAHCGAVLAGNEPTSETVQQKSEALVLLGRPTL